MEMKCWHEYSKEKRNDKEEWKDSKLYERVEDHPEFWGCKDRRQNYSYKENKWLGTPEPKSVANAIQDIMEGGDG